MATRKPTGKVGLGSGSVKPSGKTGGVVNPRAGKATGTTKSTVKKGSR